MNNALFKQLLDRYVTGTISAPERIAFFAMLEHEEYRTLLGEILSEEWSSNEYEQPANEKIGLLVERYVGQRIKRQGVLKQIVKFTAAAAVVSVIVVGIRFLAVHKDNNNVNATTHLPGRQKIVPGKYKATLTLADGSIIVLDSVLPGELTTQGNTLVIKKDSELAYHASGIPGKLAYNSISTGKGETYSLSLSDGSKVWLNASSSIRFPVAFDSIERNVSIKGEVYFEVAKDHHRPFIVEAGNALTEVLGTHFNINAYDNEGVVKTTLLEGSVKVSTGKNNVLYKSVVLQTGQQASIDRKDQISTSNSIDTEEVVAWKNGRFQFNSTGLKAIMRQMSRWYNIDVEYKDNIDPLFTGQINRSEDISNVLKLLASTGEVHFKIEGNTIIVSK